ncbi:putative two-component system response regulator, LuxR family protein [Emticicia aquatilis]|uniref:Two-component system response regulator, LuxR family protein n=2 Tax=Emticicia aquatilis TaxID=1537369 RepID=A0A916YXZ2_9BACT|nr:putative two-component system response regulator, LuxR family protein [Emticicia aquatilis]
MLKTTVAMNPKVKLFLADSYQLFAEGLSMMLALSDNFQIVGIANNNRDLINSLPKSPSDVLIIDANFFFQGDLTLQKRLKDIYTGKILILHDSIAASCLKKISALADCFVSKCSNQTYLIECINKVYNGLKIKLAKESLFGSLTTEYQHELVARYSLTTRELEVIRLIALEFLSAEIAEKLCVSEFTVDTYRKNITRKLNARNVASIVNFAHRWQLV